MGCLKLRTPMKAKTTKCKKSVKLPSPTRNTQKFANKSMTDTSGEINLQSKQDIICHEAKVKPATAAHYVADVIPLFSSYPTLR